MIMSLFLWGAQIANKYAGAIQRDINGQTIRVKYLYPIAWEQNRLSPFTIFSQNYDLITISNGQISRSSVRQKNQGQSVSD